MRLSEADRAKNREQILNAAGRLFREKGIDGIGLADVMGEAGFTHGGFYNHFESKDALAAEVVERDISCSTQAFADKVKGARTRAEAQALWRTHVEAYLSSAHRDDPGVGCTMSALAAEVPHHPRSIQQTFREQHRLFVEWMARLLEKSEQLKPAQARGRALRAWSQMLGAVTLARALAMSDRAMSDEVLANARKALLGD